MDVMKMPIWTWESPWLGASEMKTHAAPLSLFSDWEKLEPRLQIIWKQMKITKEDERSELVEAPALNHFHSTNQAFEIWIRHVQSSGSLQSGTPEELGFLVDSCRSLRQPQLPLRLQLWLRIEDGITEQTPSPRRHFMSGWEPFWWRERTRKDGCQSEDGGSATTSRFGPWLSFYLVCGPKHFTVSVTFTHGLKHTTDDVGFSVLLKKSFMFVKIAVCWNHLNSPYRVQRVYFVVAVDSSSVKDPFQWQSSSFFIMFL